MKSLPDLIKFFSESVFPFESRMLPSRTRLLPLLKGISLIHQTCLGRVSTWWEGVRFPWRTPTRWGRSHV